MIEASYISLFIWIGYAYEPSEWLNNSIFLLKENDYIFRKGEKLGEVTLDLRVRSIPVHRRIFQATYECCTEIYAMKSIKN
jgi:hypothetical protein